MTTKVKPILFIQRNQQIYLPVQRIEGTIVCARTITGQQAYSYLVQQPPSTNSQIARRPCDQLMFFIYHREYEQWVEFIRECPSKEYKTGDRQPVTYAFRRPNSDNLYYDKASAFLNTKTDSWI